MLVLSILIMLALGVAVASFFIAGAQWLLLLSAALVLYAFYLSRRTTRGLPEPISAPHPSALRPSPEHLQVTIDDRTLESGRHREPAREEVTDDEVDGPRPHSENGRAVAS